MMENLKQKLSNAWAYIALAVAGIVGILVYFYKGKQKDINALKAQIDLAETQKQADLLEVQINQKKDSSELLKKEVDELDKASVQLYEKRKAIAGQETSKTEEEALNTWNKK